MTTDFQLLPVDGNLAYTADFSAELAGGATLAGVAWSISPVEVVTASPTVMSPTLGTQSDNLAEAQSTIKVSRGVHGRLYVLQAVGTTSTGEVIPKDVAVVCMNG